MPGSTRIQARSIEINTQRMDLRGLIAMPIRGKQSKWRKSVKHILAAFFIIGLFFPVKTTQAANAKIIEYQNEVVFDFPNSILFTADLGSNMIIKKARLHYGSNQDSCGKTGGIAYPAFDEGKRIDLNWEWDMRLSGGEPPGATIWWFWEVTDTQGNVTFTNLKEKIWLDDQHNWKTLSEGLIRLHYFHTDSSYGEELKNTAVQALQRLENDIGIAPVDPIDLYIYSSTQEMRDAIFYEPGWTGGLAYPEYNILTIGIDPLNMEWGKVTEAHEMTHVLVGDYTFSCLGSIPTWLNEGLAVYGEGGPNSMEAAHFEQNRMDDSLLSFKVLSGGFSEDPSVADLSYSQSYYMVEYLLSTYGKTKMLALLQELKNGEEIDESLKMVYGFPLAGFEDEWRSSLELKQRTDESTNSIQMPTIVPTIQPIGGMPGSSKIESRVPDRGGEEKNQSAALTKVRLLQGQNDRTDGKSSNPASSLLPSAGMAGAAFVVALILFKAKRGMK